MICAVGRWLVAVWFASWLFPFLFAHMFQSVLSGPLLIQVYRLTPLPPTPPALDVASWRPGVLDAAGLGSAGQKVLVAKAVAVGPTRKTEDPGLEPWRLETWDLLDRKY